MVQREELRGVAQMPLAEDGGGVAALLDQFRQGHFAAADADLGAGPQRAMNADAVRIAARQQPGARGGANRLGHVEVAEDAALGRQAVEVRRVETFGAEHADIRVALVVGEDDDDVRERGRLCRAGGVNEAGRQEQRQCQKRQRHGLVQTGLRNAVHARELTEAGKRFKALSTTGGRIGRFRECMVETPRRGGRVGAGAAPSARSPYPSHNLTAGSGDFPVAGTSGRGWKACPTTVGSEAAYFCVPDAVVVPSN